MHEVLVYLAIGGVILSAIQSYFDIRDIFTNPNKDDSK